MIDSLLFLDSLAMPHVAANHGEPLHYRNGEQNTLHLPNGHTESERGLHIAASAGAGT